MPLRLLLSYGYQEVDRRIVFKSSKFRIMKETGGVYFFAILPSRRDIPDILDFNGVQTDNYPSYRRFDPVSGCSVEFIRDGNPTATI